MKKLIKKINDWLLFGKKKEDYVDFIIAKVKLITELNIKVKKSIDKLKIENDACLFECTLKDINIMEWAIGAMKEMADLYGSINKYIDEMTDKVEDYKITMQLICYRAKFL